MSEEVYEKWAAIVHRCYGKRFVAVARRIWTDVWCVINGIKPAWLVDYLPLDETKLYRLIEDSALGGILILQEHSLAILTLNSDLLLINASSLVNINLPTFVDITEKSGQPSVIANCTWEPIESTIQSIQAMVTAGPAGELFTVYLTVLDHVNLCTVFGWLLGYPIVYWFDGTAQCTMEQLSCYTATVSSNLVTDHELYSFTVPECLHAQLLSFIDKWMEQLQDKARSTEGYSLKFHSRQVTVQQLVL